MKLIWSIALAVIPSACCALTAAAQPNQPPPSQPEPTRIMLIPLQGDFGRDITKTPFKQILDDARESRADVLIFKIDCNAPLQNVTEAQLQESPRLIVHGFAELNTFRDFSHQLTDDLRDDPRWTARTQTGKPRLVMWVNRALGGPALLPWIAPEVYFSSNGQLGGLANFEWIVGNQPDGSPQIRVWMGFARAKGLAERAGHDPRLVMAMIEPLYQLSVSFRDGKPVFSEDTRGDEVIKIGARDKPVTHDEPAPTDPASKRFLSFTAASALKLGVSRGTVDTLEDLTSSLAIPGPTIQLQSKAESILKNWGAEVAVARERLKELRAAFAQIKIEGDTPIVRNQARAKQLEVLERMLPLLTRFREAISPVDIPGTDPKLWNDLATQIESLRSAMNSDR